jgi:hypothetical protein
MPTNIATFRARLLDERAAVVAELAAIDLADEQAKIASAEATVRAAQSVYDKAAQRWSLVAEKQDRLAVLDAQITLITP